MKLFDEIRVGLFRLFFNDFCEELLLLREKVCHLQLKINLMNSQNNKTKFINVNGHIDVSNTEDVQEV